MQILASAQPKPHRAPSGCHLPRAGSGFFSRYDYANPCYPKEGLHPKRCNVDSKPLRGSEQNTASNFEQHRHPKDQKDDDRQDWTWGQTPRWLRSSGISSLPTTGFRGLIAIPKQAWELVGFLLGVQGSLLALGSSLLESFHRVGPASPWLLGCLDVQGRLALFHKVGHGYSLEALRALL